MKPLLMMLVSSLCLLGLDHTNAMAANGTRGYALVVGNSAYVRKPLTTPKNDATEIANTLRRLNFDVTLETDLSEVRLRTAVQTFASAGRGKNLPMIFYFAGHGVQVNGVNYLVSSEASFNKPSDIPNQTVSLTSIFEALRDVGNVPKIIILDACRANPFAQVSVNEWIPGLAAPVNAPGNTFIAFATDPGNIASDGVGKHSPYSRSLLKHLKRPGLLIEDLFRQVREDVQVNTDGIQTPWENTSLTNQFYFWEPVFASVQILDGDDDVVVLAGGNEVAGWNNDGRNPKKIPLQGGLNDIVVKVYNQRSYTGGIPLIGGHLPEGWRYSLQLRGNDNSLLASLSDSEHQPADNGPRHGKLFTVAKFQILVNEQTGAVTVVNPNFRYWQQ